MRADSNALWEPVSIDRAHLRDEFFQLDSPGRICKSDSVEFARLPRRSANENYVVLQQTPSSLSVDPLFWDLVVQGGHQKSRLTLEVKLECVYKFKMEDENGNAIE